MKKFNIIMGKKGEDEEINNQKHIKNENKELYLRLA